MPRANRYMLPGYACHPTHRCHNGSFLFKFARDRDEYRRRLRQSLKTYQVSLLNYVITSNHTHLLVKAGSTEQISEMMQKLEGEFATVYNLRKRRRGAFWSGRFHSTMVQEGTYLWNCLKYIDLNMVRARVVAHPGDWEWCGYRELTGARKRYRLLDLGEVAGLWEQDTLADFAANYKHVIEEAIARQELCREPWWRESIAVGSEDFVSQIQEKTTRRVEFTIEQPRTEYWSLRETGIPYGAISVSESVTVKLDRF